MIYDIDGLCDCEIFERWMDTFWSSLTANYLGESLFGLASEEIHKREAT